jgi:transposase
MTDTMEYSSTIRARMIRRMVGPGAVSARALARETGISNVALSKWLRQAGRLQVMSDGEAPLKGPTKPSSQREFSAAEKLRAVLEASQMEGEALGDYLRRNGLHQAELEQWRQDATAALEPHRAEPARSSAERRRIKELERELRKKEKALAETAALLVLRKKLNALWGDGDDDTDENNGP